MKRTQSATFATENRKPVAAAGTKTIARNKVHTTPRTNARLGLCPSRSKISGTTTTARRIAAKVSATIQRAVAVPGMAFRATASNRQRGPAGPEKTIFASKTSALPITGMARATKRPQKVVGMHFFNPPMLMQLVEVIRADTTSDATLQAAVDLATSFGKTVVVVKKDVPGFITTRVLGPYFEEAGRIHETEGG